MPWRCRSPLLINEYSAQEDCCALYVSVSEKATSRPPLTTLTFDSLVHLLQTFVVAVPKILTSISSRFHLLRRTCLSRWCLGTSWRSSSAIPSFLVETSGVSSSNGTLRRTLRTPLLEETLVRHRLCIGASGD